jgi:glyoxylate reductase
MSKPKVYLTREVPEKGLSILREHCQIEVNTKNRSLTKDEIISKSKDADGLITLLSDSIDSEVIDNSPELKVISNYAVGYNNIDVKYATKKGVAVTNTPGVLTETTADLAWALLLATARRLVEADVYTREELYEGWAPKLMLGTDVHGKTLGIIGLGQIGKAVAKRAKGFDMKVLYNKRTPLDQAQEDKLGVSYRKLDQLLKEADFISVNAPLNSSTHHLIGKEEFDRMKESAIIINTGRGPILEEKELVNALKAGKIAGAGLDVYENEPKIQAGLKKLNNVVLTPHTGSGTVETRNEMAEMVACDMIAALKGAEIPHLVNPVVINKKQ